MVLKRGFVLNCLIGKAIGCVLLTGGVEIKNPPAEPRGFFIYKLNLLLVNYHSVSRFSCSLNGIQDVASLSNIHRDIYSLST